MPRLVVVHVDPSEAKRQVAKSEIGLSLGSSEVQLVTLEPHPDRRRSCTVVVRSGGYAAAHGEAFVRSIYMVLLGREFIRSIH